MKQKIKPLGNRVVVERVEAEKTKGGILLPESAKEKPKVGKVLAVGPGNKNQPLDLKVGDLVLFSSYAGAEYKKDGEELLILSEDDVLAKWV